MFIHTSPVAHYCGFLIELNYKKKSDITFCCWFRDGFLRTNQYFNGFRINLTFKHKINTVAKYVDRIRFTYTQITVMYINCLRKQFLQTLQHNINEIPEKPINFGTIKHRAIFFFSDYIFFCILNCCGNNHLKLQHPPLPLSIIVQHLER